MRREIERRREKPVVQKDIKHERNENTEKEKKLRTIEKWETEYRAKSLKW